MNKKRRRLLFVLVGILLLGTIAFALASSSRGPEVETRRVTRGTFLRYVEEDGRARVRDRYVVSSPIAGTLERIVLRVGDAVRRGDVLAVIHRARAPLLDARTVQELRARVGAAEAALASTRASAARAESASTHAEQEVVRARALVDSGSVAARDLEHAELEASIARREREAARFAAHLAEHEVDMARVALSVDESDVPDVAFAIRAPADGKVLRLHAESETVVGPGTPLLEVGDLSATEIVVDVLSTDAVRIEPGSEARIGGFGGDATFRGRVRIVEPTASVRLSALGVEERRVDVVVDPIDRGPNWARVGDGYRVDVRIPVERIERTLRVPTSALFRSGDAWQAFVVRSGRVRRVRVDVASYGPIESAVRSGLALDAAVVVEPPEDLEDGDAVELRRSGR